MPAIAPDRRKALFLAKRMLPEYVFDASKLENNPITFPEVQTLMDGITVGGHKVRDVQQVLNIRDAWVYLLEAVGHGKFHVSREFFCAIHARIAREEALEWGVFRTGNVGIAGTSTYKAPDASTLETTFQSELPQLPASNPVEYALSLFLWGAYNQFFWDGNKRTARLMASGILLNAGIGVFNIRAADILEFNTRMLKFYDTGNADHVLPFLAEKCVVYEALDDAYCQKPLDESKNNPESREFTPFDDFVRELRGNAK